VAVFGRHVFIFMTLAAFATLGGLKPDSFAPWAKRILSSLAGIVFSLNTLRPCCGPIAMR
jgi:hypothetical protein